jgi:hypothetical protein
MDTHMRHRELDLGLRQQDQVMLDGTSIYRRRFDHSADNAIINIQLKALMHLVYTYMLK